MSVALTVPATLASARARPAPSRRKKLSKAAKTHLPRWTVVQTSMEIQPSVFSSFANDQLDLMVTERAFVINEAKASLAGMSAPTLQSLGLAFIGLRVTESSPWIGANVLLTLEAPVPGASLQHTQLRGGDVIEVDEPKGGKLLKVYDGEDGDDDYFSGVILSISRTRITLVISSRDVLPDEWSGRLTIKKLINDVPFRRTLNSLCDLIQAPLPRPELHLVAFSDMPGRFAYPLLSNANMLDQSLNRSQKDAVRLALAAGEIALIHGPPGTGKTHTLLEIIRQFVRQGQRILVCGPSNVSVDNLAERLGKLRSMSLVRVGHPARILPGAAKYGLDYQINSKDKSERSNAIREEIDVLTLFLQQCTVNEDHRQLGAQIKKLKRREEAFRPKEADQIIAGAQVVLSTLNGAASPVLASSRVFFDVVIIDEATQTTEAECWIAAQKAPKLILAGDHHQLPPTVMSVGDPTLNVKRGSRRGPEQLQFTMFERMREKLDKRFCQMLTTQYRMNQQIMKVSSERLYGGLLVADESVAKHVLSSLPHVRETKSTRAPIVYINTAGCGLRESQEETQFRKAQGSMLDQSEVRSKVNVGEADLAVLYVDELIAAGVPTKDIALISPYGGQVRLLKMLLRAKYPDLEIGSVDGFQGREKEAVILSFVRSNEQCSIGFLRDYRRNNVAITRARRHLCIIADGKTVPAHDPFLKAFFAHLRRAAIIRVPILAD